MQQMIPPRAPPPPRGLSSSPPTPSSGVKSTAQPSQQNKQQQQFPPSPSILVLPPSKKQRSTVTPPNVNGYRKNTLPQPRASQHVQSQFKAQQQQQQQQQQRDNNNIGMKNTTKSDKSSIPLPPPPLGGDNNGSSNNGSLARFTNDAIERRRSELRRMRQTLNQGKDNNTTQSSSGGNPPPPSSSSSSSQVPPPRTGRHSLLERAKMMTERGNVVVTAEERRANLLNKIMHNATTETKKGKVAVPAATAVGSTGTEASTVKVIAQSTVNNATVTALKNQTMAINNNNSTTTNHKTPSTMSQHDDVNNNNNNNNNHINSVSTANIELTLSTRKLMVGDSFINMHGDIKTSDDDIMDRDGSKNDAVDDGNDDIDVVRRLDYPGSVARSKTNTKIRDQQKPQQQQQQYQQQQQSPIVQPKTNGNSYVNVSPTKAVVKAVKIEFAATEAVLDTAVNEVHDMEQRFTNRQRKSSIGSEGSMDHMEILPPVVVSTRNNVTDNNGESSTTTTTTTTTINHPIPPQYDVNEQLSQLPPGSVKSRKKELMEWRSAADTPPSNNKYNKKNDINDDNIPSIMEEDENLGRDLRTQEGSPNSHISGEIRLMRELNKTAAEKNIALRKVIDLEKENEVLRLRHADFEVVDAGDNGRDDDNNHNGNNKSNSIVNVNDRNSFLMKIAKIAREKGDGAAVRWAEEQAGGGDGLDDNSICMMSRTREGRGGRKRMKSPRPAKRRGRSGRREGFEEEDRGQNAIDKNHEYDGVGNGGVDCGTEAIEDDEGKYLDPKELLLDSELVCTATSAVAINFVSDLARYVVRAPYGTASSCERKGKKRLIPWSLEEIEYTSTAKVDDEETIEVAAFVIADGSVLIVNGPSSAKHGTRLFNGAGRNNCSGGYDDDDGCSVMSDRSFGTAASLVSISGAWRGGYEWRNVSGVGCDDDDEDCMGRVVYIDRDGDENEYWLDAVYEEARSIRETYCSNIISAATALQVERKKDSPVKIAECISNTTVNDVVVPPVAAPEATIRLEMIDKCIGTDPVVNNPNNNSGNAFQTSPSVENVQPKRNEDNLKNQGQEQLGQHRLNENVAEKSPETNNEGKRKEINKKPELENQLIEEMEGSSQDTFTTMFLFVVSTIFNIFWLIIVKLPLRLITTMLWILMAGIILSTVWLYLADDNGAMSIGAGVNYNFNPPGIW